MDFSLNNPWLFVIVAVIVLAVLGQSVFFLVRALKRAKELGIANSTIKKTVSSSAIFTIAPAIAIVVGVIVLAPKLGVALPWLRLSVIGSLSYETIAAENTLEALGGISQVTNATEYVTIAWVMTLGILIGLILVPILAKPIQKGMVSIGKKDKRWSEIFSDAMFMGMISAFVGYVFCDVTHLFMSKDAFAKVAASFAEKNGGAVLTRTASLIPVCVMAVSAVIMAIVGILSKKTKARWLADYALPISLIIGMASAIPFTIWLG
jgi:hypothetical protein